MQVFNADVAGLCRRLMRFYEELQKSGSSNTSDMLDADKERLQSFLAAARQYHDWVIAQPQLDMPETYPDRMYDVADSPVPSDSMVENEHVRDTINLLAICHLELVNSQSARLPSGISVHDSRRFGMFMDKVESFLENYINQTEPLDLPESSPRQASTKAGRKGVNPS